MRYTIYIFISLFLVGCSTISPRIYNGSAKEPNLVSLLYTASVSRVDGNPLQSGSQIITIRDSNGQELKLSSRLDLKPSTYTIYVNWWKVIEDNSYWAVGPGASLFPIIDGQILQTAKPYKITFKAKKGITYMIDIESTMKYTKKFPEQLCIIGESHNAKGAEGPSLNPGIRYASPHAKIIACGKQITNK
jgi:hypothetical protein